MFDKFGKEVFEVYNRYWFFYQVFLLKWLRFLEKDVEKWVKELVKDGRLRYEDIDDGENLYFVFGKSDVIGGEIVDWWYVEVDK